MIKPQYDFILIDTPPTLDLLTVNGLSAAADSVIIPVVPKYLDAKVLSSQGEVLPPLITQAVQPFAAQVD